MGKGKNKSKAAKTAAPTAPVVAPVVAAASMAGAQALAAQLVALLPAGGSIRTSGTRVAVAHPGHGRMLWCAVPTGKGYRTSCPFYTTAAVQAAVPLKVFSGGGYQKQIWGAAQAPQYAAALGKALSAQLSANAQAAVVSAAPAPAQASRK